MQRKTVTIALIVAVVVPLGIWLLTSMRAGAIENQKQVEIILRGGQGAVMAADSLVRMSRGAGELRRLLRDEKAPPDARLIAGLELAEYRVATGSDLEQLEKLVQRPSPLRQRFVAIYADNNYPDWSEEIEQLMLPMLDDPEPAMRRDAVTALYVHNWEVLLPQVCTALQRLARDIDPNVRADAMLRVSACPRDQFPQLLTAGAQDPDPAVRLAVLKRLGWRLGGLEDTPADVALRRNLATTLLHDSDPAVSAAAKQYATQ